MKKTTKSKETEQETQKVPTRAEKKDAVKSLAKEILKNGNFKSNELIEEVAKVYAEKFKSEETENPNDVKGRVGSVLDVMKKEGEVLFEKGVYSLKTEEKAKEQAEVLQTQAPSVQKQEKPSKARAKKVKKEEPIPKKAEEQNIETAPNVAEKPAKKSGKKTQAKEEVLENKGEENKEKPPVKKRTKTAEKAQEKKAEKAEVSVVKEEKLQENPAQITEKAQEKVEKIEEKIEEKLEEKPQDKSPQGTLMDMSFLLGGKTAKAKTVEKAEEKEIEKTVKPTEEKAEETENKPQEKSEPKTVKKVQATPVSKTEKSKPQLQNKMKTVKDKSADEKLQEAFLSRLYRLGGEYFEYYSIYLLEKYSRKNGRRLEALKITAGERDGGIDGEIELTDKLGFRETIYIQSKNWDPTKKGDEKMWVVGETLLQQFIGACVCRQAKDGKQHCRGIFITTSRFTPEAKRILNDTQDKFVGYDGTDLYETAKECAFGIIKKNGEYALDEQLLSGVKAFYSMD